MWHGRQSSQLEIAPDSSADGSCDPAEIIHGCERFGPRIIHGRGRDWPMLIRWTPGATPTWTLPTPPCLPPLAVLALFSNDFYSDNHPRINSLLSEDYCSNIAIRSLLLLCLLQKCDDKIALSRLAMHIMWLHNVCSF